MSESSSSNRDIYPDALRALALTVVVLGHWIATLPRMDEGRLVETDHLLDIWPMAGLLTWLVQVVPLFVFVSAAVSTAGVERRWLANERQFHWWGGRALALTRPTVTYLAALTAFGLVSLFTSGRLLEAFNTSLTVHLWFLIMLLTVQALLPLSVAADRRFGLGAVFGLIGLAAVVDLLRGQPGSLTDLLLLGERVTESPGGIGWLNALLVWLLPQQLGIAWQKQRFRGAITGLAIVALGALWLWATTASGYPIGMVGRDFEGNSNMLPPTLALMGVMWLQVGLVLLLERPARVLLSMRLAARVVTIMGALGMPLYLWHKLAELPAAWVGERLGLPLDLGNPGEPDFWLGRLVWLGLCALMVAPVMVAVVSFELTRKRQVPTAASRRLIVAGGLSLMAGLVVSLAFGAMPGAVIGLVGVALASMLLRDWRPSSPRS